MLNWMISFVNEAPYYQVFFITYLYFLLLYFGVGSIFSKLCEYGFSKGWLNKIIDKKTSPSQRSFEIKNSLYSIIIFGFSAVPVVYLIRNNYVSIAEDNVLNLVLGLLILNVWNELHFYVVHRFMHTKWLMKKVHKIHHQSVVPTLHSVYSFHWFEAALLSTVPLTIIWFYEFSLSAIFLYPLSSILLNFAGHCNFRFGTGKAYKWLRLGTRHNEHHHKFSKKYGFVSTICDDLARLLRREKID